MIYADGDKYEGDWRDGKKHVRRTPPPRIIRRSPWPCVLSLVGAITVSNDDDDNNNKQGFGIVTYMNGSKYEGTFINGERDGKGVLTFSNKDRCAPSLPSSISQPCFVFALLWPLIVFFIILFFRVRVARCRYDGDWKQGKKEGTGTYLWANGSIYQGEYVNGKKEGKGIMIYNNGTTQAQTRTTSRYVQHSRTWHDTHDTTHDTTTHAGDRYEGEWKGGRRHGYGTETWINGVKYEGEWRDGKRQGFGKVHYANGDKYEGEPLLLPTPLRCVCVRWCVWRVPTNQLMPLWGENIKKVSSWAERRRARAR